MSRKIQQGVGLLFWGLLVVATMAGCVNTRNIKAGEEAEISNRKYRLTLKSEGKIGVLQELEGASCEDKKLRFVVSFNKDKENKALPIYKDCSFQKNAVVYWTRNFLPEGDYLILIESTKIPSRTKGPAKVFVKYTDPNFDSGDDFAIEGAKELEVGRALKGKIEAGAGNATDWVRVSAKQARIPLTMILKDKSVDVEAEVYAMEGTVLTRLGRLVPKKKSFWTNTGEGIWVKLQARSFLAEGEYTLMRGDLSQGKTGVNLSVIDRFPTSENAYTFLLKSEGLKVKDQVSIFGKGSGGKLDFLGKCLVSTVDNDQARCDLKSARGKEYADFKATRKEEG